MFFLRQVFSWALPLHPGLMISKLSGKTGTRDRELWRRTEYTHLWKWHRCRITTMFSTLIIRISVY